MIFPEDEEFLAHYGKKGMKWGVRTPKQRLALDTYNKAVPGIDKRVKQLNKKPSSVGGYSSPGYRKAYKKIKKEETKKAKTQLVLKARSDLKSGKLDKYDAAIEAKYIKNKQAIGKKEAKKIYNKDAQKITDTLYRSGQPINGKELSKQLLAGAALGTAAGLVAGAAARVAVSNSRSPMDWNLDPQVFQAFRP